MRRALALALVASCGAPIQPGGGTPSGSPPSTAPTGATPAATTGTTATGTATTPPPAGPWTVLPDPIIDITDGGKPDYRGGDLAAATGDFDGDGYADLVVSSEQSDLTVGTVDVWYGPLVAGGDYTPGTSDTQLTGSDYNQMLMNAGDVDGDGIDDLLCGGYLVHTPPRGTVADVSAAPIAGNGNWLREADTAFGDVDGDGWRDVVRIAGIGFEVRYGPLTGSLDVTLQATPDSAQLQFDPAECSGYSVDILPDVSGDGFPEIRAGGMWESYDGPWGCEGRDPHAIWSPGDARGRTLTLDDNLVPDLPMDAYQVGDVDGDGVPELVTSYDADPPTSLYSLADSIRAGSLSAPISTAVGGFFTSECPGDLDGDGRSEILGQWATGVYAIIRSEDLLTNPQLDLGLSATLWPSADTQAQLTHVDMTGDGIPDLVAGPGLHGQFDVLVYDGATFPAP